MNCFFCAEGLTPEGSGHFCTHCGRPQPVLSDSSENAFLVFGLQPQFGVDLDELEKRYYQFSRQLHPDRYAQASPEILKASMDRMGLINQSYKLLRDPKSRREHLLRVSGIKKDSEESPSPGGSVDLPIELAGEWFEIQEEFMEQADDALSESLRERIEEFDRELIRAQSSTEKSLLLLEKRFDETQSMDLLKEIDQKSKPLNYFESLRREVQRKLS